MSPASKPNPVEAFLLVKLMEECAEVIQACSKALEHGFRAVDPWGASEGDNVYHLSKELGDVLAAMHILCESVSPDLRNAALNHRNIEGFADTKRKILRELAAKRKDKK